MSKNAPDTRNKLDNQRNTTQKLKKRRLPTKKELSELREINSPDVIKLKLEKKPTKGQIFKQQHGFSKSTKRAMQRTKIPTIVLAAKSIGHAKTEGMELYKQHRKNRKLKEKKIRQEKRAISTTYKRLNGGKKTNKGQQKKKTTDKKKK